MTLIHSLLRLTNFRNPFLRTLVPSISTAFALQAAVAIPSILAQNEQFYDFSGSLTYIGVTFLSLYLPSIRVRAAAELAGSTKPAWPSLAGAFKDRVDPMRFNWRQVVLTAAVTVWATRLGSYLFQRVLADGHDSRFDEIKKSPPKFFAAFMAQATWVSLCTMPLLALNSIPHSQLMKLPAFGITDLVGLALFIGGLSFEVVADRQKNAWVQEKKNKQHDEDFLTRGLWSKSRHPNYFGETTLWTGIATTAAGVLASNIGQAGIGLPGGLVGRMTALSMAYISPAFVTFLLLKVSGIPLSENKYDKKYGDRKDYQKWKKETPMFIPKL